MILKQAAASLILGVWASIFRSPICMCFASGMYLGLTRFLLSRDDLTGTAGRVSPPLPFGKSGFS